MILEKQKTKIIFAIPALLILTAVFGNLFVEGWNWSIPDFIIATILLFGSAFIVNLIVRSKMTFMSKLIISLMILFVLILVWIELAVGIFGSPFAGS